MDWTRTRSQIDTLRVREPHKLTDLSGFTLAYFEIPIVT